MSILDEEFIKREWKQNCGNTLILTGKRELRKEKDRRRSYFQYIFKETKTKGWARKGDILKGGILDPLYISEEEKKFLKKSYKQNCGNTLFLTGKTRKGKWSREYFYIFKETNYKGWASKASIYSKKIEDKALTISDIEFCKKNWKQHCGNILKLTGRNNGKTWYKKKWEYVFKETNSKGWATKNNIINGKVLDPLFQHYANNEENSLRIFIKQKFPNLEFF